MRAAALIMLALCALPLQAQTLDVRLQCSQTLLENGDGERLILADQGRFVLDGTQIKELNWESSQLRRDHGHECSIDLDDEPQAEVTASGWRISLRDAVAARAKRGYDYDRGYRCSIRLERDGALLHIKPSCPALCGVRKNFTALTVKLDDGSCRYDE